MWSISRSGQEESQNAREFHMVASLVSAVQTREQNYDLFGLLRDYGKNDLRETSYVVLRDAFSYLESLIPQERKVNDRPYIKFITGAGVAGSCKPGSKFIEVDTACGITRIVSHETFHFWLFRDEFTVRMSAFHKKAKEQSRNETMINIIGYSMAEAGAHLFEAMFLHKSATDESAEDTAKYMIRDLCESFSPENGYRIIEAVYNRIRRGELEEVAGIGLLSARKGVDLEKAVDDASTNIGQALAMLVFAANGYDIKRTFDTLISGPEEILSTISAMGRERVDELMKLISDMADSCGIEITKLIETDAEESVSSDKGKEAAPSKEIGVIALERVLQA